MSISEKDFSTLSLKELVRLLGKDKVKKLATPEYEREDVIQPRLAIPGRIPPLYGSQS